MKLQRINKTSNLIIGIIMAGSFIYAWSINRSLIQGLGIFLISGMWYFYSVVVAISEPEKNYKGKTFIVTYDYYNSTGPHPSVAHYNDSADPMALYNFLISIEAEKNKSSKKNSIIIKDIKVL